MSLFMLIVFLLGIVYGGITIIPCVLQIKKKQVNLWANIMMAIGALLVIVASDIAYLLNKNVIFVLILGLVLIHIAAINNGLKLYNKIHIKHHLVRLCVSIVLIILYIIAF